MSAESPERIIELDGLRALAVLGVVVDHFLAFALGAPGQVGATAFWLGLAGVRYFFVLSGFVISRRLVAEHRHTGTVSLRGFWTRRAFRILPAFWVYLAVVALLGGVRLIHTDSVSFGRAALLVANILPVDWFHEHIWTLSVEEQFYILAPLAGLALLGRKRRYSGLALALLYFGCLFWHRLEHALALAHVAAHLDFLSQFRFICCGVLLGVFAGPAARLCRPASGWIIGVTALATALVRDMPVGHYWLKILLQFLQPPAIALVIGWVAFAPDRCGWLRQPALQWIGRRSYSIYLWQQLFLGPPAMLAFSVSVASRILAAPVLFLASALSYGWVERPMLRLGRRAGKCS